MNHPTGARRIARPLSPHQEFDKSIMKYPNIERFPRGASNDLIRDLQHPKNPVPALDINNLPKAVPASD